MMRARVWIAFLLLSSAWGSSYLFIRIGLEQLSPLALVALRLFVGTAGLGAFAAIRRLDLRVSRKVLILLAILATFNTSIPFLLITFGEVTVTSGLASVLNSTVPIFSVLIAGIVLHDEPIIPARLGGVVAGFVGVLTLLSRDLGQTSIQWTHIAGQGAIVLAAVCYAASAVFVRLTLRDVSSMTIATYCVGIAGLETVAISLVFSPPPVTHLRPASLMAILWLGLLGSAFAYLLSFFILEQWGASRYTLVAYMLPVVGLTLGVLVLHETLTWSIAIGSVLVVSGVALASLTTRPTRKRKSTSVSIR